MKKLICLLGFTAILFSCKKKEDPEPAPIVTPKPPEISVKVDGREFSCSICTSSYKTGGGSRGVYFGDQNTEQFQFFFYATPKVGIYELKMNSEPSMNYTKAFTYYKVTAGSLTITAVDTSANGAINKLTGAFTAKTDSANANNPVFKLTDGIINLNNQ